MANAMDVRAPALDVTEAAMLPALVRTVTGGAALQTARAPMARLSDAVLSNSVLADIALQTPVRADGRQTNRRYRTLGRAALYQTGWRG